MGMEAMELEALELEASEMETVALALVLDPFGVGSQHPGRKGRRVHNRPLTFQIGRSPEPPRTNPNYF